MIVQFNGPEDARWQLLNYKVDDIITDYTGATNGAKLSSVAVLERCIIFNIPAAGNISVIQTYISFCRPPSC
jgi:hypothetical protein